jgi:hypothetical protein
LHCFVLTLLCAVVALDWSIWIPDVCLWSKTFLYKGRHKEEGVLAVEVPQLRVEAGKVLSWM